MKICRALGLVVLASSAVGCLPDDDNVGVSRSGLGSPGLVISAVYGGGGNSGATLKNDYVELFNRGSMPVSTAGLSIQYAGATATAWTAPNSPTLLPTATIPPGGYFLVGEAAGTGGTVDLPAPDASGMIAMGASSGKVALVNGTAALGCGATCASDPSVIDFVGFGSTANDREGSPAPAPSNTNAIVRGGGGCTDSDNNQSDFTTQTASVANLHNSGSTAAPCMAATDDGGTDDGGSTTPPDLAVSLDMTTPPDLTPANDDFGTPPPAGPVVISQIYGGGGNTGASFALDYVELFNRGTSAVAIGGWSIQYGSSNNAFSRKADLPANATIAPGHYFLVSMAQGTSGGAALPAPDYAQDPTDSSTVVNLSATSGKVALVANPQLQTCGTAANRCNTPWIMDLVGYGTAMDYEGAAATGPTGNVNALFRAGGGCIDTGNNKDDFSVAAAAPRNSASPAVDCTNVPVPDMTTAVRDMSVAEANDLAVPGGGAGGGGTGGGPDMAHKGDTNGGCSVGVGGTTRAASAVPFVLALLGAALLLRRRRA